MYGGSVSMSSGAGSMSLEDRKLFIGGLGWDTTEKQLSDYFGKYGEIESINLKTNPNTGRSRGFAFIVFANAEAVDQILDGTEHVINNRKVDPKKAIARTGKIFVGGIKPEISDEDVKTFFSQFGKVTDIEVPFDKYRNIRKGFCFVTFEQENVVNELLKNPQQTINGYTVDLRKAMPKPEPPMIRGWVRGSGGGGVRGSSGFLGRGGGRGSVYNNYGSSYGSYSTYGSYPYESSYSGYGGGYGGSYGNEYEHSNGYGGGYGDYSYSDGYSRGRSQQPTRHQPY